MDEWDKFLKINKFCGQNPKKSQVMIKEKLYR